MMKEREREKWRRKVKEETKMAKRRSPRKESDKDEKYNPISAAPPSLSPTVLESISYKKPDLSRRRRDEKDEDNMDNDDNEN